MRRLTLAGFFLTVVRALCRRCFCLRGGGVFTLDGVFSAPAMACATEPGSGWSSLSSVSCVRFPLASDVTDSSGREPQSFSNSSTRL